MSEYIFIFSCSLVEVSPYIGEGFLGVSELQPIWRGEDIVACDDGDDVAMRECGGESACDSVDSCTGAFESEVCMYGEGEIEDGCTGLQGDKFSFWCEDLELFIADGSSCVVEEFCGVGGGSIEEVDKDLHGVIERIEFFSFFVSPVSGGSEVIDFLHTVCTNLDFYEVSERSEDAGMEGSVSIWFGYGDVIFEASWFVLVECMDESEYGVALVGVVACDTESHEVADV